MRTDPRRSPRILAMVASAGLLAVIALVAPPTAGSVRAAEDVLRLEGHADYRVAPDEGHVAVVVDLRATFLKPDTADGRYYTDRVAVPIPLEATDVVVESRGVRLRTSVRDTDDFRVATARFQRLYYKQTRELELRFTLPSGKPRSTSDIRVGKSFTTFTAWAWGDPGHSSVEVFLPDGFVDEGFGDELTRDEAMGGWDLRSGTIDRPDEWYHVIVASREYEMTANVIQPAGRTVVVHAWPEDPAWRKQVMAVMDDGLPILERMIGLPWSAERSLDVFEVHTPVLEGYAGVYDPRSAEIRISEDLDDQTILHEAAHLWVNGGLVEERWISEGLAEHFADRVRDELKLPAIAAPQVVPPTAKGAFPLNSWPDTQRIDDAETEAQEAYGYGAAYTVIRTIARDVGDDKLRSVLYTAWDQLNAYEGDRPPESIGTFPDWRHFLDLVEEIGGMEEADELFKRYVATPAQIRDLDARERARGEYERLDAAGDDWAVPTGIRMAMSSWRFSEAETLMDEAMPALAARDAAIDSAVDLDVTMPQSLENTFEGADRAPDLRAITKDLTEWGSAAEKVSDAREALAEPRTSVATLGLIGQSADGLLAAARGALETGDLALATSTSAATIAMLAGAESAGTSRAIVIGVVLAILLLAMVVLIGWWVRRHRRGGSGNAAASIASPGVDGT
jgi:hypothetical protein